MVPRPGRLLVGEPAGDRGACRNHIRQGLARQEGSMASRQVAYRVRAQFGYLFGTQVERNRAPGAEHTA
jgi:hypothetical protein